MVRNQLQKIVYESLDVPLKMFLKIHWLLKSDRQCCSMEVRSRRVGGSTYQVPVEVSEDRGIGHAMNWIIKFSRSRKGKSMAQNLSQELTDAFNNVGASSKKRDDTHKMAESNKAFAHFRW